MPDAGSNGTVPEIALRPIDIDDWAAVHEWASTIEACRYQEWGPNTAAETKAFVAQAVSNWNQQQQDRYVWVAEQQRAVIGIGELTVRSQRWRQGEVGYAVHVNHWAGDSAQRLPDRCSPSHSAPWTFIA